MVKHILKLSIITIMFIGCTCTPQVGDIGDVKNISNTTWTGYTSHGNYYEYNFNIDGSMYYQSPTGFWKNGTWKQEGNRVYMETNNKYAEYEGEIAGEHMEGQAWNIKGFKWSWEADMQCK